MILMSEVSYSFLNRKCYNSGDCFVDMSQTSLKIRRGTMKHISGFGIFRHYNLGKSLFCLAFLCLAYFQIAFSTLCFAHGGSTTDKVRDGAKELKHAAQRKLDQVKPTAKDTMKKAADKVQQAVDSLPGSPEDSRLRLLFPVKGRVIAKFNSLLDGEKLDGVHILSFAGAPVSSCTAGTVLNSATVEGFGHVIVVLCKDESTKVCYAYLSPKGAPKVGAQVNEGQVIGRVIGKGKTPILYVIVEQEAEKLDPEMFFHPNKAHASVKRSK